MPLSKYKIIYNWKRSGLIYDNYDDLYDVYINTMECQHCKKEFTKNNWRCMDHNHETGLFRKIVCHKCNSCDSYLNYPNGYTEQDRKEYHQAYRQINKQRISERDKQKIECECGSIVRRSDIAQHRRSKKHTEYLNSI